MGQGQGGVAGRMRADDVVQFFVDGRRGKLGVREKVEDILARKAGTSQEGWVEWRG